MSRSVCVGIDLFFCVWIIICEFDCLEMWRKMLLLCAVFSVNSSFCWVLWLIRIFWFPSVGFCSWFLVCRVLFVFLFVFW